MATNVDAAVAVRVNVLLSCPEGDRVTRCSSRLYSVAYSSAISLETVPMDVTLPGRTRQATASFSGEIGFSRRPYSPEIQPGSHASRVAFSRADRVSIYLAEWRGGVVARRVEGRVLARISMCETPESKRI